MDHMDEHDDYTGDWAADIEVDGPDDEADPKGVPGRNPDEPTPSWA